MCLPVHFVVHVLDSIWWYGFTCKRVTLFGGCEGWRWMWPRVKDPYYRTCAADLQPGMRKGQFMRHEGAGVQNPRPDVFCWSGP